MNEKYQSTQRSSPKISFRLLCLLLLLVGLFGLVANLSATASAQPVVNSSEDGIWYDVAEASIQTQGTRLIEPKQYRTVAVHAAPLHSRLIQAPLENTSAAQSTSVIMSLPLPDGTYGRFQIVDSPIMAPELAAKFPQIKTYAGQGIDDPMASVRFDQTPAGFHAMIFSPSGTIYIDPYQRGRWSSFRAFGGSLKVASGSLKVASGSLKVPPATCHLPPATCHLPPAHQNLPPARKDDQRPNGGIRHITSATLSKTIGQTQRNYSSNQPQSSLIQRSRTKLLRSWPKGWRLLALNCALTA